MKGWRLLLTRPVEECEALAATLAEHQVFSSSLPLLAIEPLEESPEQRGLILELDRYCAVVVVSKPAARLGLDLIDRYWPHLPADQHWFSVGAATGALLEDRGLPASWPAVGDDSEALLELPQLVDALSVRDPRVLIMRGEGGREFLADRLRGQGVAVDYLELYRRCLPVYPVGTLAHRVESERLNGLVVSSGQGLENLQHLAGAAWPELSRLTLFVPSPRVAGQAVEAGAKNVVDCRGASAAALLAALRQHPAPAH
ncbi:uroporphyrinogen-III synthase [Pseudomonas sp. JS3066]|uniref:uroporphyrinogen-III synthase n=1 Tax=unclassified Pseudomonas TaxID=196821 RepID=UPI0012C4EF96|nr:MULTISPECIES: uroporphyrinogen-III synthase [unclassified Pseudomonas]MDH4656047.1 uroporphyrinogen-III synthase [Pseudomonas sp. BN606]MRK21344.1 uroporphyrinogen-III synthase [Pseudomonas sp. JG-B]WVK92942.1 uroporphyrinogen-III synthase [Pseudomonas sp. JS3066]